MDSPRVIGAGGTRPGCEADISAAPSGRTRVAASVFKRCVDISVSALLLMLLLPLILLLCALIRVETPGWPIFGQKRRGLNGAVFTILKLRTMRITTRTESVLQATHDDARVTRLGRWLRRTSIDELPQLLNVFLGQMSLVGPRPHAVEHDDKHSLEMPNYGLRFRTRPGLTGLAQISGFRGELKSPACIRRRVDADNLYIDSWGHWLDFKILLLTLPHLVLTRQAY